MNDRKPLNYDDLFPERWLHADDLQGKDVVLTISAAYQENLRIPGSRKAEAVGVLSFAKTQLEYVLNKTNARFLKTRYGKNGSEDWPGKRITLRPVHDESGKSRSGFRILFVDGPKNTPATITDGNGHEAAQAANPSPSDAEADSGQPEPPYDPVSGVVDDDGEVFEFGAGPDGAS